MGIWNSFTNLFSLRATKQSNGEFFYIMGGGSGNAYALDNPTHYIKAFEECPPLAAAITRKAAYAVNGITWVLNLEDDDEAEGDYAKHLRRLFKKPNILQNWKQFKAQYKVFQKLFGYCPVLVVNPSGFPNLNKNTQMWILPPWCVDVQFTGNYYSATEPKDLYKSVHFTYAGKRTPLELDHLIFLKDISIPVSNNIIPQSCIKSLAYPIATVVSAMRSNNTIIKRRGGIGILSNGSKDAIGSVPLAPADKNEVQEKLKTNYGLSEDQSEIIITSANLNWQPMTFDAKQLMLHESNQAATEMICDVVGFNALLLSSSKQPTFDNINSIKKEIYQNSVIPEDESDHETFSDFFKCAENKCRLNVDFTHVEALQKNKKDAATARYTNTQSCRTEFFSNVITLNQWLERIEEETVTHGNEYYYQLLARGWVFDNKVPVVNNNQQESAN